MTREIDFPFHIDARGRTAAADPDDHLRDLIEQLLLTSPGERVNRPDFGGGLLRMIFEPTSPEVASALELTIQAGLQRWLGDLLEARDVSVRSVDSTLAVEVAYAVRATGEARTATFTEPGT